MMEVTLAPQRVSVAGGSLKAKGFGDGPADKKGTDLIFVSHHPQGRGP
jgi:hypothetical protein